MKQGILVATLCAASVAACASSGTSGSSEPPVNQRVLISDETHSTIRTSADPSGAEAVIAAPPDKVWAALLVAYPAMGIPALSINRPIGEVGNRNFRILHKLNGDAASRYLNCGFDALVGPQANSYPIDASMLTVIRPDSAGATHIQTHFSGSARKIGAVADPLYCGSTGALEEHLVEVVRKQVTQ